MGKSAADDDDDAHDDELQRFSKEGVWHSLLQTRDRDEPKA